MQVWRENQQRIVGFFPRAHSYQLDSHSWIYTKHQHKYSILLTKIMILATDYLYRYTCEMPTGVREYVDKGMNCEDIAMNFLVSNFRCAPSYFSPSMSFVLLSSQCSSCPIQGIQHNSILKVPFDFHSQ